LTFAYFFCNPNGLEKKRQLWISSICNKKQQNKNKQESRYNQRIIYNAMNEQVSFNPTSRSSENENADLNNQNFSETSKKTIKKISKYP